ncbi:MAG: hypothetical protein JWR44_316 [Hymenobacter sp.]|jgi:hypothetical protein|nr:hypothetical protein [Hymenobacter sp.]
MPPEDIDDLFREKLDGHPTPPGDALWARLQANTNAEPSANAVVAPERLDQLFNKGLSAHATPPSRELWERLEDEHLRPRKRWAAAWWPMAIAAALAILLVAGGAGLWLGFPQAGLRTGTVATTTDGKKAASHSSQFRNRTATTKPATEDAVEAGSLAANTSTQPNKTPFLGSEQKNAADQATRPGGLASTASKARMAAFGQSPRRQLGGSRQPDAAALSHPLVARTTVRTDANPAQNRPTAADEQRPAANPAPQVAEVALPRPASEIVPARLEPTPSLASSSELITVEVRSGRPARPSNVVTSALAAVSEPTEEPRRLGGRLLQQAGRLVRGERLSLAEVTGLPENVTLRATVAGRNLTKTIQL